LRAGRRRFTRRDRLTREEEFRRVFDHPRRLNHDAWVTLVKANDLRYPRLGLAISRKSVPTAVARNRVKRVVRESFRLNRHRLGGFDIVILARRGLAQRERRALREALEQDWTTIERCKDC
jgi:ribonuclease P protein component